LNAFARAVRAYPTLLKIGFAEAVAYRAEMVVWMLTTSMPLVSLALWSAVAENGPVGRFDQRGFTTYFLATLVVRQLTGSWLVWEMNQEIRTGTLARRLLKPIHPLVAYSAENLAAVPLRAALCVPIAAIAIALSDGARLPRTAAELSLFALSLLGAWLINFLTMAIIGTLAFYLESSTAVFEIWLVAFMLLSGYLVPLELFPSGLAEVVRVLPFRYMVAYPVELASGLLDPRRALVELGIQWAFVALSALGALAAFRAGVRRFGAYGG
jgi:ABC-2 type transport system permease protein